MTASTFSDVHGNFSGDVKEWPEPFVMPINQLSVRSNFDTKILLATSKFDVDSAKVKTALGRKAWRMGRDSDLINI